MKFTAMLACATLALGVSAYGGAVAGAFDLQITEIWMGNEPGTNLTEDWFEVTNLGSGAWTSGVDGQLYFDDGDFMPIEADLISGVNSIAPGETVIFIDDTSTAEFLTVWGAAAAGIQLGTYSGEGLSQDGDGVALFVSNGAPQADFSNVIAADAEAYPDANLAFGGSWDVVNQQFSFVGDIAGSAPSVIANDVNQFAIASLGSAVPEPSALLLGAFALIAGASARR